MGITKAPKILLGVGFIFSAITTGLLGLATSALGIVFAGLAPIALYTYLVGFILRGVGWIGLGRSFSNLYKITGIMVLLLGIGVVIFFSMKIALMMALSWSIYTLLEFYSYSTLRKISKLFTGAMISIIGLIIVDINLAAIPDITGVVGGGFSTLSTGLLILALSALLAAIGSFTMKPQQKEVEAEKTEEEMEKAA